MNFKNLNWNIKLAFINSVFAAIGMGISHTAFSIYVTQILGQSNLVLGNFMTVSGLASTIFVFPSGWAADKWRRDILIRVAVIFSVLSQILIIFSLSSAATNVQLTLSILFLAQLLAGLGWGLNGPALQALIADSMEAGERSYLFSRIHLASWIAEALGPLMAAGLTLIVGDTWQLEDLSIIIILGSVATLIAILSSAFASDKKIILSITEIVDTPKVKINGQITKKYQFLGREFNYDIYVPSLMVISGMIIGFGAGATIAFFPVLFASPDIGYGLSPFPTYLIMGVASVVTGFMGIVAQKIIKSFGRIGSMFLTQGLAIICLIGIMINLILFQNNLIIFELSLVLLVVFYISRSSLMNASGPVSRSIVMDIVPSNSRGKWNSLETLAWGMFWSVSASIGGFIVDTFGFMYVFLFTATLYSIATLMLLVIKDRVPKESVLMKPFNLKGLELKNRIILPPINLDKAQAHDGQPNDELKDQYIDLAKGGTGLLFLGSTYVSIEGKTSSFQLGIHDDYTINSLSELVSNVTQHGSHIGIQLFHGGFSDKNSLNVESLSSLKEDFRLASLRADKAGFEVIEIGSSLDNIFSQILLEFNNTFEDKISFITDLIKTIKSTISESKILSYRLSKHELLLDKEKREKLIKSFNKSGIDLLNISALGLGPRKYDILREVRQISDDTPIILSGEFDTIKAEQIIKEGITELVGFGHTLLRNTTFPRKIK